MSRALATFAVIALILPGCGGDDESDVGGAPSLEILDPGSEPRTQLVIRAEEGDTASSMLTLQLAIEATIDDVAAPTQPVPEMSFDLTTTVEDVSETVIATRFEYGDVEVVAQDVDPAVVERVESTLAGFEDISGELSITPQGVFVHASVDTPDSLDPALESMLDQVTQQFQSLTVPFPDEPVGVGASWLVKTDFEVGGIVSNLTSTYSLADLNRDEFTLDVESEQTIEPGSLDDDVGNVVGGETTGTGTLRGSLNSLLPLKSEVSSSGNIVIEFSGPEGESQTLDQKIDLEVRVETAR